MSEQSLTECRTESENVSTISWKELRAPGAMARFVRELAQLDRQTSEAMVFREDVDARLRELRGAGKELLSTILANCATHICLAAPTDHAFAVLFDPDHLLLAVTELPPNADSSTIARAAARTAVKHQATSIVLGLARGGGSVVPTSDDFSMTRLLVRACDVLGLVLLDVVLATDTEYYSFRELGMLSDPLNACAAASDSP